MITSAHPECQDLSFNGMPIKVRNTFLNVEEVAAEEVMTKKSRSVPLPPAFFAEVPEEVAGCEAMTPEVSLGLRTPPLRNRPFSSIPEGLASDEHEPIDTGFELMTPEASFCRGSYMRSQAPVPNLSSLFEGLSSDVKFYAESSDVKLYDEREPMDAGFELMTPEASLCRGYDPHSQAPAPNSSSFPEGLASDIMLYDEHEPFDAGFDLMTPEASLCRGYYMRSQAPGPTSDVKLYDEHEPLDAGFDLMTPEVSLGYEPLKISLRMDMAAPRIGAATNLSTGFDLDRPSQVDGCGVKLVSHCSSDASTCAPSPASLSPRLRSDPRSELPPGRARLQLEDVLQVLGAQVMASRLGDSHASCFRRQNCDGEPGQQGAERRQTSPPQSMVETGKTTFMIRSLPHSMDRPQLERLLDAEGFRAAYDFIYLPSDLKQGGCFGYGFINLVTPVQADRFARHFDGLCWPEPDQEPMGVHISEALQGLGQLVDRYRNSPLMHKSVRAGLKPATYRKGKLAPFPSPTERLRPPRVRTTQNRKPGANH